MLVFVLLLERPHVGRTFKIVFLTYSTKQSTLSPKDSSSWLKK